MAEAPAAAQERTALARQLFDEGVAASDAEDWVRAEDCFRRARALHSSPALSLNHATALSHLGRLREASDLFRVLVADPTASDAVRAESRTLLGTIEPRIGRLTILVAGASDTTVRVDGVAVSPAELGTPIPIDPGAHSITSSRDEVVVAHLEVTVLDGEVVEAALEIPERVDVVTAGEWLTVRDGSVVPGEPVLGGTPSAPPVPTENLLENGWLWLGIGLGIAVVAAVSIPVGLVASTPGAAAPPVCGNLGCWEFGP